MARKEQTRKQGIFTDSYKTKVYDREKGRSGTGEARTKRESRERAYRNYREKNK